MDKYEYNLKLEEITKLADQGYYEDAADIIDTIDWRRVRNVRTLCMISEIYEEVGRLQDSKALLLRAYRKSQAVRSILFHLTEISVKLREFDDAAEFYSEFVEAAPHDNSRYLLKYMIYRGRGAAIEDQIEILGEYNQKEYTEKYAYGLAKLYYLGDSRIYMQDEEDLICLTRDHTLANQKLDAGIYTEAQAKKSADQHRLTLYVGVDKNGLGLNADSRPPVALQPGRKFLLCTDGLVDMCSEQEIQDILSQDYFNEAAVLVQTAVNYGGIDNVTCIVLEVIPIEEPAELESDPML